MRQLFGVTRSDDPADVAVAWEKWCGDNPWSRHLRKFGELGGSIKWWDGYPRSKSAIPLTFTLIMPTGEEFEGHSRLKDIRAAVSKLEEENDA